MAKQTKKVTTKGSKKTVSVPSRLATVIKRRPLRFWGALVLFVVLVGIIVWQGYIWHEKQQFNRAEKTLDALQSDIIAALGQPLTSTKEKSCTYGSYKYYTTRKPNCHIDYELIYGAFNIDSLVSKSSFIESVLANNGGVIKYSDKDSELEKKYVQRLFSNSGHWQHY